MVVGLVLGWVFLLLATAAPASPASTTPLSDSCLPDLMVTADNVYRPTGEGGRIAPKAFYQQSVDGDDRVYKNIETYF